MTEVLRAAFDIDDTLVDIVSAILRHYESVYGIVVPPEKFYSRDPEIWGVTDHSEAIHRVNAFLTSDEFIHTPPFDTALPVLQNLKSRGYELLLLTGRGDFLKEVTNQWREEYFANVFESDVIFTNYFDTSGLARTKGEVCHDMNVKVLTDDHSDHLLTLGAYGVRGILYGTQPHTSTDMKSDFIVPAATWPEVGREVVRVMSQYE